MTQDYPEITEMPDLETWAKGLPNKLRIVAAGIAPVNESHGLSHTARQRIASLLREEANIGDLAIRGEGVRDE